MPELTYREAVRDALARALREDDSVFIMGEDIAEMGGSMAVTQGLLDEFGPQRVRNTPISEMAIMGSGIGAAIQGMRPIVEIMYEDFLTLSMEQLVNQAAKHRTMSGGQVKVPLDDPHAGWRGLVSGSAARAAARSLVRPRTRSQGRVRLDARGRPRPSLVGHLRRQPRRFLRAPNALPHQGRGAEGARADPRSARRASIARAKTSQWSPPGGSYTRR